RRGLIHVLIELGQMHTGGTVRQQHHTSRLNIQVERPPVPPVPPMLQPLPHRQRRRRRGGRRSENEVAHRTTAESRACELRRRARDSSSLIAVRSSRTTSVSTSGPPDAGTLPPATVTGTAAASEPVSPPNDFCTAPYRDSMPEMKPEMTSSPASARIVSSRFAGPFQSGSRLVRFDSVLRTESNFARIPSMKPCTTLRPASSSHVPAPASAPRTRSFNPVTYDTTLLMPFCTPVLMPSQISDTLDLTEVQALPHSDLISVRPLEIVVRTIVIAPLTSALIASQIPEKICLTPSQAPFQSPRITDTTVLMTPCTTFIAAAIRPCTAPNTVVTTGSSAWMIGISSPAMVEISGPRADSTIPTTGTTAARDRKSTRLN